jgi:selenocysteine-specific elongation factor
MLALGIAPLQDVINRSNLDGATAKQAAEDLFADGEIIAIEGNPGIAPTPQSMVIANAYWGQLKHQVLQELADYHKSFPLRSGIPREELKSRLKLSPRVFNSILHRVASEDGLEETGSQVRLISHKIQFTPQQQRSLDGLLTRFAASPFSPPTVKECQAELGEELYNAITEVGLLVPIPPDVVFRKQDYELMVSEIIDLLKKNQTITAGEVRDHFNTSRRYVLALLEFLDAQGVTVREGDVRRLK